MNTNAEQHPDDLSRALALLAEERARRIAAEAEAATAKADAASAKALVSHSEALIARLKLEIEKVRRELYGSRSERKARLLEQMELQLEELEADAGEDETAAEMTARASTVKAFERKRPSRKPFPEHLPRERVVIAAPASCPCCGSARLSKLGEDITETLEVIPRQWKVIQTVREKFTCRECEKIAQPPAPFHVTPRGFAGPNLLAMILFEKFAQHQPLNRQSERYAREGIDLSLSTLADQVGACATALKPIHSLIEAYVLAAERLHGDDTTVPILAKGKTDTGRIWTYVRDDRPFGGQSPLRRCSTRRETVGRSIPSATSRPSPAFCRRMPMAATIRCSRLIVIPRLCAKHCAGRIPAASSSCWPILPRTPSGEGALRRSRRWRWMPSDGSTRCSTSNARSTGFLPTIAWSAVARTAGSSSKSSRIG
ncbi:Transposase and inactivated derivatives [Pannonibacter phragmitetus]|uniref:Transposase and inactivated derivatives n=1 Tax=Pannonibacter phragmitetus TaxID=121719 RepID=A0A378ZW83_9HYPH|nr:Transposase and inactivated derivatives [Pannonibacter phragmitetus]SUB01109.1 Transposase and inactivated derivatives [Pannonibacter phragmitetus]SUB02261.1 Transposase and inactivated derivatives [Pannonibacter phragmitetus]